MDQPQKKVDKFIKQGEICYDRNARIAKAECDANEIIEEILKEQKQVDKEFPNNRIINELCRAFANGPLIWKLGQMSVIKDDPLSTSGHPDTAIDNAFQNGPLIWNSSEKRTTKDNDLSDVASLELGKAHVGAEASLTIKNKLLDSKVKMRAGVEAEATALSVKAGKIKLEVYDKKGVELSAKLQAKGLDIKAGNVHVAKERVGAKAEVSVKVTGLEVNTGNVSVVGQDNTIQANAEAEAGIKVAAGNVSVVGSGAEGTNVRAEATVGIQTGNIQVGIKRRMGASISTQPQVGNLDLTIGSPTLNVGLLGTLNLGIPFLGGGTGGVSGGEAGGASEGGTSGASEEGRTGGALAESGIGGDSASGTVEMSDEQIGVIASDDGITGLPQSETHANTSGGLVTNRQNENQTCEYIEGTQYSGTAKGDVYGSLPVGDMENCTVNPGGEFVRLDSDGASEADMEHIAMILNEQKSSNPNDSTVNSDRDQNRTQGNFHTDNEQIASIYLDDEEFDYEDEFGKDKDKSYKKTKKPPTPQTNGTRNWARESSYGKDQPGTCYGSSMVPRASIKEKTGHDSSLKPVMPGHGSIPKPSGAICLGSGRLALLPNKAKLPIHGLTVTSSNTNTEAKTGSSLQQSGKKGKYASSPFQRGTASPVIGTSGSRPSSKRSRTNSRIETLPPISDTNGITRPKTANYNEIVRKLVNKGVNPEIPTSDKVKPIPTHYDRDRLKNDLLCAYIPSYVQNKSSKPLPGAAGRIFHVGGIGSGDGNMYSCSGNEKPQRKKEKKKPSGSNKNIHTIFTIDDSEDTKPIINYGNYSGFGDD